MQRSYNFSPAKKLYQRIWARKLNGWELINYEEIEVLDSPYTLLFCKNKHNGEMTVFMEDGWIREDHEVTSLGQVISSIWHTDLGLFK